MSSPYEAGTWFHNNDSDRVIVFVHGLHSNSKDCWKFTSKDRSVYWPELVLQDSQLGAPSIYLASYYTEMAAGDYGVSDCADEMLRSLRETRGGARSVIDRKQIVFVCHSAGGNVTRYLLERHYELFQDKTVLLLLLSSPAKGAPIATKLSLISSLYKHRLAKELRFGSKTLLELHGRFGALVKDRRIPNLSGVELFEHSQPWRLTVVSKSSAGLYFGAPIVAPRETHSSIAKPNGKRHIAHKTLVEQVQKLEPIAPQDQPPADLPTLITYFKNHFGYVWEGGNLGTSRAELSKAIVYWPVKLRHPTLIHAGQAFTAASMQRLGARVILAIDDLGNQRMAYDPGRFGEDMKNWFTRAGGTVDGLSIASFSEMDNPGQLRWVASEKWLGSTNWTLEQILPVCKLTRVNPLETSFEELLQKKPRRLLSPPVVWAALASLVAAERPEAVITLSGYDERPLWDAWRQVGPEQNRVPTGHLYLPDLRPLGPSGDPAPLHMEDTNIGWASRDDILASLTRVPRDTSEELVEPNSLHWWALQLCIFMPSSTGTMESRVVVDGERLRVVFDAHGHSPEKFSHALAIGLEEALL